VLHETAHLACAKRASTAEDEYALKNARLPGAIRPEDIVPLGMQLELGLVETAQTRDAEPAQRQGNSRSRRRAALQPHRHDDEFRVVTAPTLDYRENHVRGRDGCLLRVEPIWIAEAERYDGAVTLASATGTSEEDAWDNLCADIADAQVTTLRRVRLAPLP
jgi:hypothetical protein